MKNEMTNDGMSNGWSKILKLACIQAGSDLRSLEKILSESGYNYYYLASFFIVVISVLIKLPSLVTSAEFYAETASIFFRQAREATFLGILSYVWADYLVTFQLLVSFALVRLFGIVQYFPEAVNFFFLLFIAFSVSLINLRVFRKLIASDKLIFAHFKVHDRNINWTDSKFRVISTTACKLVWHHDLPAIHFC